MSELKKQRTQGGLLYLGAEKLAMLKCGWAEGYDGGRGETELGLSVQTLLGFSGYHFSMGTEKEPSVMTGFRVE